MAHEVFPDGRARVCPARARLPTSPANVGEMSRPARGAAWVNARASGGKVGLVAVVAPRLVAPAGSVADHMGPDGGPYPRARATLEKEMPQGSAKSEAARS